jgi:peptidyl-prolyl cis-trans isomerase SurA
VAGAQFHPGVAAQVGDQTITTRHVDQVTDDYCKAVEKVSKGQAQSSDATPMRYLTHEFATDLIVRAAAEQLADSYDVQPTSDYKGGLAQLEGQLTKLSDDQKAAVREIVGARAYAQDVLTQIGEISLKKQGTTDATTDDQYAEGQKLLTAWVKDHDVEINPKYSIDLGSADQVDTDLSYAVGTTAKAGALAQPDAGYTSSLPGNFVCLDD